MKLYCVRFHDADEGELLSWHANKADAERALKALQRERDEPQGMEEVSPLEIDTTKAGLLAWLNSNFTRDNG